MSYSFVQPTAREVFESARTMWPGFISQQLSNQAVHTQITLHHGEMRNDDERPDTFFVRIAPAMGEPVLSPMMRVSEVSDCLMTDGYRRRGKEVTTALQRQINNPWVVLAVMQYIKSYRQRVYEAALAIFETRVRQGIAEEGERRPPLPPPLTYVSTRTAAVLRGDMTFAAYTERK